MNFNFYKKSETKNWPHQIIDFLYQHYTEAETELNNFLYTDLQLDKSNTTHKDKIKELLDRLQDKQYLTWKANKTAINEKGEEYVVSDFTKEFHELPGLGLKDARLEAQLTLDGLDYAIELKRERQKHRIYKYSTPMSVLFAALAFSVSLMTYLRGCDQSNQSQQIQLQLPTEVKIDSLSLKKVHIQTLHHQLNLESSLSKQNDTADLSKQPVNKNKAKEKQ